MSAAATRAASRAASRATARGAARPARRSPSPRPAPPRENRHLRVAPRPRRGLRVAIGLGAAASAVSLFLVVAFHVMIVQGTFELERLGNDLSVEQRRYERNRLAVAERSSPDAVVEAARRLGLVEPSAVSYVEVPQTGFESEETDRTSATLDDSLTRVKQSLGAGP